MSNGRSEPSSTCSGPAYATRSAQQRRVVGEAVEVQPPKQLIRAAGGVGACLRPDRERASQPAAQCQQRAAAMREQHGESLVPLEYATDD